MQLFSFSHDALVKPGCCGWRTSVTYWLAESRDGAKQEIQEETPEGKELSGLCANCMAELIANRGYEVGDTGE